MTVTYRNGAFHPAEPLDLPEGTQVEIQVEAADEPLSDSAAEPLDPEPYAFLRALSEANLDGPPDWSENINDYLTGRKTDQGRTLDGRDVRRG